MESDISDKPEWVARGIQDPPNPAKPIANHVKQRQTLREVDDQIGKLVKVLKRKKRLSRTVFIFTSDNGLSNGKHQLVNRKYTPYRSATEVPLVIRYGKTLKRGRTDRRVAAANIDVAATILKAAHLPELTAGRPLTSASKRSGIPLTGAYNSGRPPYCGWRTKDEMFVRYASREEEYYNYRSDPYELLNRANDPKVAGRVAFLRHKAALACSPTPPGYGSTFENPLWSYPALPPTPTPTPTGTPTATPNPAPDPEVEPGSETAPAPVPDPVEDSPVAQDPAGVDESEDPTGDDPDAEPDAVASP